MVRLIPREPTLLAPGAVHLPGWLAPGSRRELAHTCFQWGADAGGFRAPRMPRGGVMSVRITCLGWHWYPYRYARTVEDGDGRPVAPFPEWLASLSRAAVGDASALDPSVSSGDGSFEPDVALINFYGPGARMGMHADRDERTADPVVSLSVGDACVFRFGNPSGRGRPWTDVTLESGDLVVFGGPSRLAYHGVPKVLAGTGDPAVGADGGRLNVTVRVTGLGP